MRRKIFLAMCIVRYPVWSCRNRDVVKREWSGVYIGW